MKRALITSVLMMASEFGTASEVQAQIVYGYSNTANDGGVMSPPASMNYGSYQGYSPYSTAYDSASYSTGSRYSPVSSTSMSPHTRPLGPITVSRPSARRFLDLRHGLGIWRIIFRDADGHEPHVQPL